MVVKSVNSVYEFNSCLLNPMYKSTIVKYTAKWCGPCHMMKPYFEDLSNRYSNVQFLKVDVDELPEVSHWANVRAMPTFSLYKNGIKITEIVGVNQIALNEMVEKLS